MKHVLQDVQLATPLLVVAASEVSKECRRTMKKLCTSQFEVSSKNFTLLIDACNKKNVSVPNSIIVQPIYCSTISDFLAYQNTLEQEKYHMFLKCYCTLVFIDYSLNTKIDDTCNYFLNNDIIKNKRISFVVFKATEELFNYQSETTCVCFDTFSMTVTISCLQDFIAKSISLASIGVLENEIQDCGIDSKSIREAKSKADFFGISNNVHDFISQVKAAMKELESSESYAVIASFYEILGLIEYRNPGSLHTHKLMPTNYLNNAFKWMPQFSNRTLLLYTAAANYFHKDKVYGRCIDCGIRMILCGAVEIVPSIANYISRNSTQPEVLTKTWDLLNIVSQFKMYRKTALLASEFSKIFESTDASNTFTIFALNIILKDTSSSSLVQIRDLCIPMILRILEEKSKVPISYYSKFLSKTMSAIGPALSHEMQTRLFTELHIHQCEKISLPLVLIDMQADKLPYTITRQEKKRRSGSGVFLYSYLNPNDNFVEITVDVNHTITISAQFENPFSIDLRADDVHLIANKNATCKYTTEYFKANSLNTIHCHITPQKVGECAIKGIALTFFGAIQEFALKDPIILNVVGNVPNFHIRTNLPLSSSLTLFDGEVHDFTIWVTNRGEQNIVSLAVNFLQPELAHLVEGPELPLLPHTQTTIKCAITAIKDEEYLAAKVVASCARSDFCCNFNIRQKLIIDQSLDIRRIYLMTNLPRGENAMDKVFIGYEVRNLANCSFMYNSTICGNTSTGLIGENESLMMVGSYSPSELITNGNDANRTKLISMTKLKEAKIGKSLSLTQRMKVARCVSMLQRLFHPDKWKFEWTVSSTRKGELVSKANAVDEDLFNGIEARQIHAKISWLKDGDPTDSIYTDSKYSLLIEFDKEMTKCGIELVIFDQEDSNDVLWEGQLVQSDANGKNKYEYTLCFGSPKSYKFYVNYTSLNGIEGQTQFDITIQE